jgi:dipeptidyl aminopeptidase/acylaminoacyl peptidase
MAIRAGVEVDALATIAGAVDLEATLEFRPEMENVFEKRIPNYKDNKSSALRARSALRWIEELDPKLPILLIHGEQDNKVGAFQSVNMANKLAKLKRPHRLILYPEDDHGLRINRETAYKELSNWFKKHL